MILENWNMFLLTQMVNGHKTFKWRKNPQTRLCRQHASLSSQILSLALVLLNMHPFSGSKLHLWMPLDHLFNIYCLCVRVPTIYFLHALWIACLIFQPQSFFSVYKVLFSISDYIMDWKNYFMWKYKRPWRAQTIQKRTKLEVSHSFISNCTVCLFLTIAVSVHSTETTFN